MAIIDFMSRDHKRCDQLFADAEAAVDSGNWQQASTEIETFLKSMDEHFQMEEEVLFPAFESASGQAMGPTQVMRHEHQQMRQLFEQMKQALSGQDADSFLGASDTLLIMMQQHNMKEEQILYPMTERFLSGGETVSAMKGKSSFYDS